MEYSYFQADGLSLEAIDTVKTAQAEFAALRKKLCGKFGADDVSCGVRRDTGAFHFFSFYFSASHTPPADWQILNESHGADGKLQAVFAMPRPNSPDTFHMASIGGLMERAARHDELEEVFGIERFMHPHGKGCTENAFVRQGYIHDDTKPTGKIGAQPSFLVISEGLSADPIATMELDGKTYFRVPNKPGTEEPIVTPPDAIPMSYDAMLKADAAEMDNRRKPSPYDMCWGC